VTSPDLQNEHDVFAERDRQHLRLQRRQSGAETPLERGPAGHRELRRDHVRSRCPNWERFLALAHMGYPRQRHIAGRDRSTSRRGCGYQRCRPDRLSGPVPSARDRTHRYELTVYALDVRSLNLPPSVRAAVVGFTMRTHILGFGRLIGTFSQPAA